MFSRVFLPDGRGAEGRSLFSGDDHEPAVLRLVGAGDQSKKQVAALGGDAGVVERLGAEIRDGVVEVRLVRRVDELIELEAVLVGVIDPVIEGRKHLILALLVEGVKVDGGVRLPVGFALILGRERNMLPSSMLWP